MASFCKACSIDTFGQDFNDLAGITSPAEWAAGRSCSVLCEGCGPIRVDPHGNCATANCDCAGQLGHGMPHLIERSWP